MTQAWFKHTLKLALLGSAALALSACAGGSSASSRGIDKSRQEAAIAMWKERCQKAGEFIHQTVEDVDGVYLTATNWYLGSQYQVELFEAADGQVLLSSQVQSLVQAMAAFSPPTAGQTTLPTTFQTALNPVTAANWN